MPAVMMTLGLFALFHLAAELRFGKAQCADILRPMRQALCLTRQIDDSVFGRPLSERINNYKRAVKQLPDSYLLAWRLGNAYAATGDWGLALEWLRKAKVLLPADQTELTIELDKEISKLTESIQ